MKKALTLLLALSLLLCLAACGGEKAPNPTQAPATEAPASDAPAAETPAGTGEAVQWPTGDITVLIPNQVGTNTDIGARIICDYLAKVTGVNVTYENNDAGAGSVLAGKLRDAKPDGQTLMFLGGANINAYYKGNWDFNIAKEGITPICGSTQPNPDCGCLIMTQADKPFDDLAGLIAYAEEHPGELTAACASGSVMELKMRSLFNHVGLSENIRYVSSSFSDAIVGLLGGNVDLVIGEESVASSYLADGSAKALISCRTNVFDPADYYSEDLLRYIAPIPSLTDVLGEDEANDTVIAMRSFIAGPEGMSDELVKVIADTINGIADDTGEFAERIVGLGGTSNYYTWTPEELSEWLTATDAKIAEIAASK